MAALAGHAVAYTIDNKGFAKYLFFVENALEKKLTEYFLKFLFLFKSTILSVNSGK